MNPIEEKRKRQLKKQKRKKQQTFYCDKQKICKLAKKAKM
jgi:hypothetical protein